MWQNDENTVVGTLCPLNIDRKYTHTDWVI